MKVLKRLFRIALAFLLPISVVIFGIGSILDVILIWWLTGETIGTKFGLWVYGTHVYYITFGEI